jgi:hypothetical protein
MNIVLQPREHFLPNKVKLTVDTVTDEVRVKHPTAASPEFMARVLKFTEHVYNQCKALPKAETLRGNLGIIGAADRSMTTDGTLVVTMKHNSHHPETVIAIKEIH